MLATSDGTAFIRRSLSLTYVRAMYLRVHIVQHRKTHGDTRESRQVQHTPVAHLKHESSAH
mgnify:CR=1 FL=1